MGRLDTLLRSETDRAPRSIVAKVFSEVSLHAAGRDQSDDITCLGIQYLGEMD